MGCSLHCDYGSPRWSYEILDCSMPMTFDTYSVCAYKCLYCFSFYQKHNMVRGYDAMRPRAVDATKVVNLFSNALGGKFSLIPKGSRQFVPYIINKKVMQWGALADQFDEFEREHGATLALLKFFDRIDYPLSFSTKAAWWTEDDRYMKLFARHRHNWHVKVSIITSDAKKAALIEQKVPTPAERMMALRRLHAIGIKTTLRLRPHLIGISDDYETTIQHAADAGAEAVTTEFFCLEIRASKALAPSLKIISDLAGYDMRDFYLKNSPQQGYKRLSRELKLPILLAMREAAHRRGMRFNVSDQHGRELNDTVN